jgi:fructose/tagatose bisphosphate aldolase
MPLVSMRQLLDHAAEHGYGIPAFNVNNLEQVQAVMTAAAEVGAPVILQASAGARKYAGEPFIKHLIQAATRPTRRSRWSCTRTTAPAPRSARAPSTWASAR